LHVIDALSPASEILAILAAITALSSAPFAIGIPAKTLTFPLKPGVSVAGIFASIETDFSLANIKITFVISKISPLPVFVTS
jgi:hypothetical protein